MIHDTFTVRVAFLVIWSVVFVAGFIFIWYDERTRKRR